jgi:uncharacterized membrane protein
MTYREKESLLNIFSGILITTIFAWMVYQRHLNDSIDLTSDYKTWGIIFLIFIGVSIVARIIIYIIFHIINAIATREDKIPAEDERDKLVKLKSTRNSHYVFSGGFVMSIIALAIGMPVYGIFIAFVISGLLSEIVENVSQIYYYRKGI